ncbi:zinc ABC transporter substrate-binding protein [Sulfurivirga sp.]|uniref:metal ABC transporter solute-binding protein, Zn/Mn family n=1 Tax=Sulfurivirga sp. TaxID=2614236 RepID=UPI0025F27770|nr:zinc ABC transporter substrate-binding protein [Sulfurivirga sp.]
MGIILRAVGLWWLLFAVAHAGQTWVVTLPGTAKALAPALGPDDRLTVLLQPGQNPHHWALKPSQLRTLKQADHIVLVDRDFEAPVLKQIQQGGWWYKTVVWSELRGVEKLKADAGHGDGGINPHLWLGPRNALALLRQLGRKGLLPVPQTRRALSALGRAYLNMQIDMADLQGKPYMSWHGAFAYFEKDLDLKPVAVIEPGEGERLSLRRMNEVRQLIREKNVRCIIYPAHQSPAVLKNLVRGLNVRLQPLDALGWQQKDYLSWMKQLADGYKACLNPS